MGVRLFDRHAKGVQLSEAGRRLYARAVELIAAFDNLKQDVHRAEESPTGKVRLCLGSAIAGVVAAPLLRAAAQKYPRIELSITEKMFPQIEIQLESRAADLAMMPSAVEIPGMQSQPVLEDHLMLFGSSKLMREKPSAVPFEDIAALPLVAPDRAHDVRKMMERFAANAGVSLDVQYELNSTTMLIGLLKEGLAYAILPSSVCADAVAAGTLARRAILPSLTRIQSIVWPGERSLTPASAAVKEQLVCTVHELVDRGILEGRAV